MRRYAMIGTAIAALLMIAPPTPAQDRSADQDAMKIFEKAIRDFEAAYNSHDLDGVVAGMATDGERTVHESVEAVERQKGREEVRAAYRRDFAENPQAKAKVKADSARLITPEVLVSSGTYEVMGLSAGRPRRGSFVNVSKKQGDRWVLVESHLFRTPAEKD